MQEKMGRPTALAGAPPRSAAEAGGMGPAKPGPLVTRSPRSSRKKNQSDVIRTRDLLYPEQIHYQTMLHSVVSDLRSICRKDGRRRRGVSRKRSQPAPRPPGEVAVVGIEPTACGL
jgi:hypothetical protein